MSLDWSLITINHLIKQSMQHFLFIKYLLSNQSESLNKFSNFNSTLIVLKVRNGSAQRNWPNYKLSNKNPNYKLWDLESKNKFLLAEILLNRIIMQNFVEKLITVIISSILNRWILDWVKFFWHLSLFWLVIFIRHITKLDESWSSQSLMLTNLSGSICHTILPQIKTLSINEV